MSSLIDSSMTNHNGVADMNNDFTPMNHATINYNSDIDEAGTQKRKTKERANDQRSERVQIGPNPETTEPEEILVSSPEPVEEPSEAPEKNKDDEILVSRSIAKIAKRESSLRKKEEELKQKERQLEHLFALSAELERNPQSVVQKLGIDPDKLYATDVERKREEEQQRIRHLEEKIDILTRSIEERESSFERRQRTDRWESDFSSEFSKEDFTVVRAWDPSGGMVRKLVADRFNRTGKLMSPTRALEILKNDIESKLENINKSRPQKKQQQSPHPRQVKSIETSSVSVASRDTRPYTRLNDQEDIDRITAKYKDLMSR